MYPPGEYDLAGFAVGAVEKSQILTGQNIGPGDVVLGLASSGPHSNGYSLVRKIVERSGVNWQADAGSVLGAAYQGRPFGHVLLEPTRIYVKPLLAVLRALPGAIKGMAHITGGGLTENVPRVLPPSVRAVIEAKAWARPAVFQWLQQQGGVAESEMHRTFNCGIGMVLVVAPEQVQAVMQQLSAAGEQVSQIGQIQSREAGQPATVVL
jgi:phosphoribosylformylglycinamidine cyclo-ligase